MKKPKPTPQNITYNLPSRSNPLEIQPELESSQLEFELLPAELESLLELYPTWSRSFSESKHYVYNTELSASDTDNFKRDSDDSALGSNAEPSVTETDI